MRKEFLRPEINYVAAIWWNMVEHTTTLDQPDREQRI